MQLLLSLPGELVEGCFAFRYNFLRQNAAERRDWKFRLVRRLYERGLNAEDIRRLFRFIDWMMDLPLELEISFQQELAQIEKEQCMPFITSVERFALEKGYLKGIEKLLRVRFGDAGMKLLPEIQQIHNHEKLEAILDALETANSPEDLRSLWQAEDNAPK